ncbi:MAG: hypothetical protein EA403_15575 [Spirochaetaceae bacterium]|nr:MAG: hypothetical protein EA403_15575 [Spirochaetaceae bacterium]
MNVHYLGFGKIEIDGVRYTEDVVIDHGTVIAREKDASRSLKASYGHTPLSEREPIPWNCSTLIVGTGAHERLPITPAVEAKAHALGVSLQAMPTARACELLNGADLTSINAVLHLTC